MEYFVSVTETLNKVVGVIADSEEEAMEKAKKEYKEGWVVLDYDNLVDTAFELEQDQKFYREAIEDGFDCWQTIE